SLTQFRPFLSSSCVDCPTGRQRVLPTTSSSFAKIIGESDLTNKTINTSKMGSEKKNFWQRYLASWERSDACAQSGLSHGKPASNALVTRSGLRWAAQSLTQDTL